MAGDPLTDRCTSPEHRQFDFWLGEWEVRDAEGTLVGRNRITRLYHGCALREEWEGVSGHRGTSLNAWVAERGAWHQTWVDSSGMVLLLEGGLRDGAMVLEGTASLPGERPPGVAHRITWSPIHGNPELVRQHWQVSRDGEAWETIFDGRYGRLPDADEGTV